MIALVDCNAFYASCEQVFRPDLEGKPVIVLSNNDGCIIAANKEAKAIADFPMWRPVHEVQDLLEKHDITVFSPNFTLYGDMSTRVMNTLRRFTPNIENYSIDEAFLSLHGMKIDYKEYGLKIRNTILRNQGIPVGVGIAPTKALAKVANKIAKKFHEKTEYVHVIDTEEKRIKGLKWTKIGDVWGIGHQHAKRLQSIGVFNALQFTELDDSWVRKYMSVVGLRLKYELQGISCLTLEEIAPAKKAIGTAKSFGHLLSDFDMVKEAMCYYVSECAEKLRKQHSSANQIMVSLETNPFRENERQYFNSTVVTLPVPTHDTGLLLRYAVNGLKSIFKEGYNYKRVGILLTGLVPDNPTQGSLFFTPNKKGTDLQPTIDKLNKRYGKLMVRPASCGYNRKQWTIKRQQLSPYYTTRLSDVLKIG